MRKWKKAAKRIITVLLTVILTGVLFTGTLFTVPVLADNTFVDADGHTVEWWNFRNTVTNNAVTDRPTPTTDKEAWEKWAAKYGDSYASSPTPPIIVDGKLYIGVGKKILEIDKETGAILRSSDDMPGNIGYAMQSPVYADGKIFIAIAAGRICAVDIDTLKVAWTTDNSQIIRGQTNSPIGYVKIGNTGYVYTGTWAKDGGSLFCATTDDAHVTVTTDAQGNEIKIKEITWEFNPTIDDAENLAANNSVAVGYYWTGAYVSEKYLAIGSDNGSQLGDQVNDTAFYTLNPKTGKIIDVVYGIKGQVRSTTVYDNGYLYFSTKGAKIYKIPVDENGNMGEPSYIDMGEFGALMSTATPVVYGGRIYLGVQGKGSQFSSDGGHGFLVVKNDETLSQDSFLYNLKVPGYPQAGALLSNYHEDEDFDGDGRADGRVYLFFTYNAIPGGIFYTYDTPGQTSPTELTAEESKIFVPGSDKQQYCISSVVVDEEGTLYYKNDSNYLFAVESNPAALNNIHIYDTENNEIRMDQSFLPKMSEYSATVAAAYSQVRIKLDLSDDVTAKINGKTYKTGGLTVDLPEDENVIHIVTSKNGKSRIYDLTIRKESANAFLAALGSSMRNTAPSSGNPSTRPLTPDFHKEVTEYTVDYITTGTGNTYDPATSALMNLFVKPESDDASITVWPGENTRAGTNANGSIKAANASGGYKYRFPVYADDLTRDSTARIVVTAQDGVTSKEYHITFSRRIYVVDVTLDQQEMLLCPGDTRQILSNVIPDYATDPTVVWSSSEESVATVDESGTVTACAPGVAVITAAAEDGTVTAECSVTVVEEESVTLAFAGGQDSKDQFASADGKLAAFTQMPVSAGCAKQFGYEKPDSLRADVTALDALLEMHRLLYGEAFARNPRSFLDLAEDGTVTKMFAVPVDGAKIYVNHNDPRYADLPENRNTIDEILLHENDEIRFCPVSDDAEAADYACLVFDQTEYRAHEDQGLTIGVRVKNGTTLAEGDSEADENSFDMPEEYMPAGGAVITIADAKQHPCMQLTADAEGQAVMETIDLEALPAGNYQVFVSAYADALTGNSAFAIPFAKLTVTAHDWENGTMIVEPGCETEGTVQYTCREEGCDAIHTESVPPVGHSLTFHAPVEATCEQNGHKGVYICEACDRWFADAAGEEEITDREALAIPGGHDWDEGIIDTEETCGVEVMVYTCRKDPSHTKKVALESEGHVWAEDYEMDVEPTCETAGWESRHCISCGAIDPDSQRAVEPLGHKVQKIEKKEAGCEEAGTKKCWYCAFCDRLFADEGCLIETSEEDVTIAPSGHKWHFTDIAWQENENGDYLSADALYVCERDETHTCQVECTFFAELTDADCETDGLKRYEAFVAAGDSPDGIEHNDIKETVLPATGHDWDEGVITTEPTRAHSGIRTYTCRHNAAHTKTEPVPYVAVKKVTLNTKKAELATKTKMTLTVSVSPKDATSQAVTYTSSNPAVATVNKNGVVTAKKYGKTVITAETADGIKASCTVQTRFYDATRANVPDDMFEAIYWAADHKITGETVKFGTYNSLTRGQFVRFLYRMAGQPKVKGVKNIFSDIDSSYTHYKAILWAVKEGLISGYSDGTFKPEKNVSRINVATILWKYAGSPKVKNAKKPYSDVSKSAAIAWGKQKGILSEPTLSGGKSGKKGYFRPKENCVRGDIIMYLHRFDSAVR